jgi:hypothetical protein
LSEKSNFLTICDNMISGLEWQRDHSVKQTSRRQVLFEQAIAIWKGVRQYAEKGFTSKKRGSPTKARGPRRAPRASKRGNSKASR